jgi:hypothetical protein
MKKIFTVIAGMIYLTAQSQTADEIIEKYTNSMGGLAAFNAVKTVKMTGNVVTQGMELPLTINMINGRAIRNDVEAMGQTITNSYIDGKGWKINPLGGLTSVTDMTETDLADYKAQSRFASQLMDYKARGHKVELLGQEDVEGIKTHKIKLTNKDDGKVTTYFISTDDNTLIKFSSPREMMGQQVEIENFLSDIKDFNGLKFAMNRMQKAQGQVFQEIKMKTIEFNVPVDEKLFDKK